MDQELGQGSAGWFFCSTEHWMELPSGIQLGAQLSSAQWSKMIFSYVWYLAWAAGKTDLSWEPFHFFVVSGSLHMFSLAEGLDFLNGSSEAQEKKVEAANRLKG